MSDEKIKSDMPFDMMRFLSSIVASSDDAIIGKTLDGTIVTWNRAAEKMYGYTAEEAIGKSIHIIVPGEKRKEIGEILAKIANGETLPHYETVRVRKDGASLDVSVTVSPVRDESGRITHASVIAQDITEQKRLADEVRRQSFLIEDLYNNAPCGYHSIDRDGVIVMINDTELKWLGYALDEVVGRLKITDIMAPESLEKFRSNFAAFKERGWVKDLDMEFKRKDGTVIPVLLSATAVYDKDGNYVMSRTIVYDVTEKKKAEDELKRINRDLVEALSKVKLLSGMIPICASCKKIRNDKGYWESVEKYIAEHSEAEFSQGICTDCIKKLYPDYYNNVLSKQKTGSSE